MPCPKTENKRPQPNHNHPINKKKSADTRHWGACGLFLFLIKCTSWGMPPLSFSEGNNLTKMFPRLTCLITINRGSRNAKDGVFYERSIKCVSKNVVRIWVWRCSRHFFCIAIDFKQFRATIESKTTYALHTIAYNNRCQTLAIGESIIPYALHTIVDSNRSQVLATIVFTTSYYSIFC